MLYVPAATVAAVVKVICEEPTFAADCAAVPLIVIVLAEIEDGSVKALGNVMT
jgi:hypothetical protein